ncbi:uncharacterized protein A4U43_C07F30120 [Asparagus officinalis]|uniref:Uncharacterized protein n=1 Tax=Asparagus officinalis TaxID=4686 RepID=A0A5P1EG38_ASPOF|nr:uncharacterized protein A4U43_C07F30120 [Asparagus officinalis]
MAEGLMEYGGNGARGGGEGGVEKRDPERSRDYNSPVPLVDSEAKGCQQSTSPTNIIVAVVVTVTGKVNDEESFSNFISSGDSFRAIIKTTPLICLV